MRKKIKSLLIIFLLIITSGCAKMDTTMSINNDKSMNYTLIMAIDKSLYKDYKDALLDEQTIEKFKENGFTVEEYTDDQNEGYRITKNYKNIDDISGNNDRIVDISLGNEDNKPIFKLKKELSKNTYSARFISKDVKWLKTQMKNQDKSLTENAQVDPKTELFFTLTLPTKAVYSNATETKNEGKTLTWNLLNSNDEYIEFTFELKNKNTKKSNNLMIIILIISIIIIVLLVLIIRKKISSNKSNNNTNYTKDETTSINNANYSSGSYTNYSNNLNQNSYDNYNNINQNYNYTNGMNENNNHQSYNNQNNYSSMNQPNTYQSLYNSNYQNYNQNSYNNYSNNINQSNNYQNSYNNNYQTQNNYGNMNQMNNYQNTYNNMNQNNTNMNQNNNTQETNELTKNTYNPFISNLYTDANNSFSSQPMNYNNEKNKSN